MRRTVIVPPDLAPAATPAAASAANTRAAERSARRFARTFLRYETGDLGREVRRALRAIAIPRLARQLLSEPPRRPAGAKRSRPGRLVGLRPERAQAADAVTFTAELKYRDTSGTLRITIARRGGRWLVTGLR
jgi:hypothetical protein